MRSILTDGAWKRCERKILFRKTDELGFTPSSNFVEEPLQKTLILLKPDAVQRGLIGEIIGRLENRGLRIVASKFTFVNKSLAEAHYAVHKGKDFYDSLIEYITASPVMAMVWEGPNAIEAARQTMGDTHPLTASPGSVRHDFGLEIGRNLTHASDSLETAATEVALWFDQDELVDWSREIDRWIFES
jgi:nucleoside-diphosphate kinase